MTWLPFLAFLGYFLATLSVIVIPKATVIVVLVLAAMALGTLWPHRAGMIKALMGLARTPTTLWLIGFASWTGLSALWSPAPLDSLDSALFLVVLAGATAAVVHSARYATFKLAEQCADGLVAGALAGLLLFALDLATGQGLSRWFFTVFPSLSETVGKHVFVEDGKVIHVSEASANRRAAILVLLMLPMAYYLARRNLPRPRVLAAGLAVVGYAAVFSLTESFSAQVALLAGGLAHVVARLSNRLALGLVATAWALAVALVIPIVLALNGAGLKEASWLPISARERIVIWHVTAQQAMRTPIIGIGAHGSRALAEHEESAEPAERTPLGRSEFPHPHNAYLQVWYELGAVGALLLAGLGLGVLSVIGRCPVELRPTALGQFCVVAALFSASYSLWQHWFLSAVSLGIIVLMLAHVVSERRTNEGPMA